MTKLKPLANLRLLTSSPTVLKTFATAARRLRPGGLFLFVN